MKSKHTPGPWRVVRCNSDATGYPLAVMGADGGGRALESPPSFVGYFVSEADADLAARAPDLLAENERLREALEACIIPLMVLGDFIGNEYDGSSACGLAPFDRCAIIAAARAALEGGKR